MKRLNLDKVPDSVVRDNFRIISEEFRKNPFLLGTWRFLELEFLSAVTNFKYQHRLGFTPKDVIQTSVVGAGSVTWNYSSFDRTNLDITTTGACTVRALVGSYQEASDA